MPNPAPVPTALRRLAAAAGIAGLMLLAACSASTVQVLGASSVAPYSAGTYGETPLPVTVPGNFMGSNADGLAGLGQYGAGYAVCGAPVVGGVPPCWNNVQFWSFTPDTTMTLTIRAESVPSTSWDNTLEVWRVDSGNLTVITHNDDAYDLDAMVTVPMSEGSTYLIGLGGFGPDSRGTATIYLSNLPPDQPEEPTAQAGDGQVGLTWAAPANNNAAITSYTVRTFMSGAPVGSPRIIDGTPPVTTATITGLTNGTAYTFTVSARNPNGESAQSPAAAATPVGAAPPPVEPEPEVIPEAPSLLYSAAMGSDVRVWWQPPSQPAGAPIITYTVRVYDTNGDLVLTKNPDEWANPAEAEYTNLGGLTAGASYTVTVTATNSVGESPESPPLTITGLAAAVTPTPTPVPQTPTTSRQTRTTTASPTPTAVTTTSTTAVSTTTTTPTTTTTTAPTTTTTAPVTTPAETTPPPSTRSTAPTTSAPPTAEASSGTSSAMSSTVPTSSGASADSEATAQTPPQTSSLANETTEAPSSSAPSPAPATPSRAAPPVGPGETFTWAEAPPAAPLPDDLESSSLEVSTDTPDQGGDVTLTATGFAPGTVVDFFIHSTPIYLGSAVADAQGVAALPVTLRPELSELHHVQATGTGSDGHPRNVAQSITIEAPKGLAALPQYNPADHPQEALSTQVATLTLVAALGGFGVAAFGAAGAASAAGAGGGGGTIPVGGGAAAASEGSKRRKMSLASAKVKHVKFRHEAERWGDKSSTWMWPWVERLDAVSLAWPGVILKYSPLAARTVNDGAYLRAATGPLWFLMPAAGITLGALAGADVFWQPLPPSLGLTIAIVLLGIADVTAGFLAAAVYTIGVAVAGNVDSWDALRSVLGVDVVFFTVALAAFAARALRRAPGRTWRDIFDRGADVVIATLFGMWAMQKVVKALPAITGVEIPLAQHGDRLAIIAGAAIVVRYLLETVVAACYPRRLAVVAPAKMGFPGPRQQIVSAAFKTFLFVLFAIAYIGNRWELWVGAALFFIPSVCYAYLMKFPNFPGLVRWLPGGILKTVLMACVGTWAAALLAVFVTDPEQMISLGFVLLSLPGLMLALLGLIGRDGDKWPETWWTRLGGIPVLVLGVLIVQKIISVI